MPLRLGDVSTERPQTVLFDPDKSVQVGEARHRAHELVMRGFTIVSDEPGEIKLTPPIRDANTHLLRILSENGDDRVVWDRRDAGQVREAFAKFKALIAKGYTAYAVTTAGKKGHRIDDFDPGLEELLFAKFAAAKEIVAVPPTMPG